MAIADAVGPVGIALLLVGSMIFGESRDALAWSLIGVALAACGVLLLILSH